MERTKASVGSGYCPRIVVYIVKKYEMRRVYEWYRLLKKMSDKGRISITECIRWTRIKSVTIWTDHGNLAAFKEKGITNRGCIASDGHWNQQNTIFRNSNYYHTISCMITVGILLFAPNFQPLVYTG